MDTKKIEELYGKIANIVNQMIPEEWVKVFIKAEIWSEDNDKKNISSISGGFYYLSVKSKKYIFAYDIKNLFQINKDNFDESKDAL